MPRNIYLCTKTANQEKYKLLNKCKKSKVHIIDVVENLPDPNEVPVRSIIIFDDILTENQQKIAEFSLQNGIWLKMASLTDKLLTTKRND